MSAVTRAMHMFNEEYPGKFSLGTVLEGEDTPTRVKVWEHLLREFDDEVILHAAMHIVSTRPDWPPDVATMRQQCICLINGELQDETGSEAWEQIMRRVNREDVEMTEMQAKALKQTGRTIYDLRNTTISNLASDRSRYIEAFNNLISKRRMDRLTMPEVKALVDRNAPALPAHDAKELPPSDDGDVMSFEEAKEQFGPQLDSLATMIGGE